MNQLHYIFPVPILQIKFDKHSDYDIPDVPKSSKKPDGWLSDLYTTFPDISDDDEYVSPNIRDRLKKDLKDSIDKFFKELNIPTNWYYNSFWYNVYYDNQGQEPHNHLPYAGGILNYWSGIYYYKGADPTTFVRDSNFYTTQKFPGYLDSNLKECFYKVWYPLVKDGDIIIFPPYLEHYFFNNTKSNQMRMTFSFNISLYNVE